jgi:hypothetical protein
VTGQARFLGLALVAFVLTGACEEASPSSDPTGGPVATPAVACLGVVASKCDAFVKEVQGNGSLTPAVGIRIACTTAPCTELAGQVTIDVQYADGQTSSTGQGWEGVGAPAPVRPPALAVAPVCLGLPVEQCREFALDLAVGRPGSGPIRSIVVRCTRVCNARSGEGTTVVTYADGTIEDGNWGYTTGG